MIEAAGPPKAMVGSPEAREREASLIAFGAYFLWPLLLAFSMVAAAFQKVVPDWTPRLRDVAFMPARLIGVALRRRLWSLAAGLVLMLPLLIFSLLSFPGLLISSPGTVAGAMDPPSFAHVFGTDGLGRDFFWLVVAGAGTTYTVALFASAAALLIGVPLGLSGVDRKTDGAVMMLVELVEALPVLVWSLMFMTAYTFWTDALEIDSLGRRVMMLGRVPIGGIVIGLCLAPRVIRLVRDQVKFFEREEFIALARAHGVARKRILWFHVLRKNTLPDLLVVGAALPGLSILTQINLDYLFSIESFRAGAGSHVGWTQLILSGEARRALLFFESWWTLAAPLLCVVTTTVGCLLWGDGLRRIHASSEPDAARVSEAETELDAASHAAAAGTTPGASTS